MYFDIISSRAITSIEEDEFMWKYILGYYSRRKNIPCSGCSDL